MTKSRDVTVFEFLILRHIELKLEELFPLQRNDTKATSILDW